ncbi:hypothetical protein JKF63_05544 [Porcisia hertigi]|uniref:PPPDE domain-containing protein n=1 Tax=Porcisia hertigi TaxID=2761500 RepID=A0A836L8Y6_9TRYP|nr:hypothetical protein JKF63_05544 [Porcisia hertigi]
MAFWCCGRGGTSDVVSKNAAELRSLEAVGLSRASSPRLRRTEVQIPVILNVYSLLESNKKLSKMGMGVFHTGVVVYGIEWGYGEVVENPNASGLFCVHPGQAAGTLYRTIRLGYTTRSPMQVDTILHRLENEWRSCEYHILHHNCNHFSQAFCDLLSTTEKLQVPAWCNRAARVGDRVIPRRLATKVQRMLDDEPPKPAVPAPTSNINEVPVSVVPRDWYLHPSVFQPLRYIDEHRQHSVDSRDGRTVADAAAAVGPGSTHYSVEYDIVPPPGYERADSESMHPSVARREMYCSTGKDGSITHMMAIEDQDPLTSSLGGEPGRRLTASRHAIKSTSDESTAPLSLGITFRSGGGDRVVLPRVQPSRSQPHSVPPTGSPKASELDLNVENVLHSEAEEESSPSDMSHLPLVLSLNCGAADVPKATPSSYSVHSRRSESPGQQRKQQHDNLADTLRDANTDASSENPLYTMRESSFQSTGIVLSEHSDAEAPPPSFHERGRATPVGYITTVSPTLTSPRDKKHSRRLGSDTSTCLRNTSNEVNDNASGDVPPVKHKHVKQPTNSSKKKEPTQKLKAGQNFSDIAAAPICDAPLSPIQAAAAESREPKNSSPWSFFKNQCRPSSQAGSGKAVCKYLSTPLPTDKASLLVDKGLRSSAVSMSSGTSTPPSPPQPEAQRDKVAASVPADRSDLLDPAADTQLPLRREGNHTQVPQSAASDSLASSHTIPVALEGIDGEHDALFHTLQNAGDATRTSTTAALQGASAYAPCPCNDSLMPATESRLSPRCNTAPLPLRHHMSAAEDAREKKSASSEQRLSHSKLRLTRGCEPSHVNLSEVNLTTTLSSSPDSPGTMLSPPVQTPERPAVVTCSRAATSWRSPATVSQQCWRASLSAAMDDTPLPKSKQNETPILSARGQHFTQTVASVLQLDVSSDELEAPALRNNNCPNQTTWATGSPSTMEKLAHTPMAPLPCRPSLVYREKAATRDDRVGQNSSSELSQATPTAQRSLGTLPGNPEDPPA